MNNVLKQQIEEKIANSSNALDLSNLNLTTRDLMEAINMIRVAMPVLKELDISGNPGIVELPGNIASLPFLERLNASNDRLMDLPRNIGSLVNLKDLDISYNAGIDLPVQLGNLTNLQRLNLSQTLLTEIPNQIVPLVNLKALDVSNNFITDMADELDPMLQLRELNISGNPETLVIPHNLGVRLRMNVLATSPTQSADTNATMEGATQNTAQQTSQQQQSTSAFKRTGSHSNTPKAKRPKR